MLLLLALLWLVPQEPKDGLIELTVRDSVTHKGLAAVRVTMVYLLRLFDGSPSRLAWWAKIVCLRCCVSRTLL